MSLSLRLPYRLSHNLSTRLVLSVLVALPAALAVGLLTLGIESAWPPLHRLDESVAQHLHTQAIAHPLWVHIMLWVSDVGSPTVMRILVGLVVVLLWLRRARRLALWAAATMLGGALIDVLLKDAVDRARPYFPNPVATAPGASFPSGHSFTAMLGAGVLVLLALPLLAPRRRIAAWMVGTAVPLVVGYSRVALGVHWASDVIGGWLLGIGLLAATSAAFETWRRVEGMAPVQPIVEGVAPEEVLDAAHPDDAGSGE
jgi:membrane-associated phospholipid phosphatase